MRLNQVTIGFETDDLDAECSLVAAGITFDHPPEDMPWLCREARLRDPDGHRVVYRAGANRKDPPWRLEPANLIQDGHAVRGGGRAPAR